MDYKAKRHSILDSLKADLVKGSKETEVSIMGRKFKLTTLSEDEEVWADGYIRNSTTMALISSRRAPRLAAAIKSIDGVSVAQLFMYPDDMEKAKRDELDKNEIMHKWWVREQVLLFLSEDSCRPFITTLYDEYEKMESDRADAIKEIPNS